MTGESDLHPYRSHTCGELRMDNAGITARLSGWVHRKRDHGNLLFIDLRDHYGLTQCVIEIDADNFGTAEAVRPESVLTVTGKIERRSDETINRDLPTGEIELPYKRYPGRVCRRYFAFTSGWGCRLPRRSQVTLSVSGPSQRAGSHQHYFEK